jgi:hypothetical protein
MNQMNAQVQQQQQQQHAAGLANLAQQRRDAMTFKGMYLLKLMQFSEHLSGFPVCLRLLESSATQPATHN